ncbi:MAG: arginine--tRNA ligase [Chloroflexia bacterium]|nr:arginine--tRNA ligase [Chloroflexia bacterium]
MFREYALDCFEREIRTALLAQEVQPEEISFSAPPADIAADLGLPCFLLARRLRRPPATIAADLAAQLDFGPDRLVGEVSAHGPYLNFCLNPAVLAERVLRQVLDSGSAYGGDTVGQEHYVILDYSSPNVARRMHVGHMRSTVIGQAIRNLYDFRGYRTIGDNHLGDWGTQFGKLIYAYKAWGDEEAMADDPLEHLIEIYARFHEEAKENPGLEQAGRRWFLRLEEGDPEARRLWQWFIELTIQEFEKTYRRMGVHFDTYHGESFYEPMLDDIIQEAVDKGVAEKKPDSPAVVLDLSEYGIPSTLLRKSDGATLYLTREFATLLWRQQEYDPALILYIVGEEQTLHFRQLLKAMELMGYEELTRRCVHISFGRIVKPDGSRFSMREGDVIFLRDLLDEAELRARRIVEEKNPDLTEEEKAEIARQVGIGALLYNDLYQDRNRDITFDWDQMLSFEGNTAPYIQYMHTRCASVLRKAGGRPESFQAGLLQEEQEQALIKDLARFPEAVRKAAEQYAPHVVAEWLYETARDFGRFWRDISILNAPAGVREARLGLAAAVAQGLRNGLGLLGIEAPRKM